MATIIAVLAMVIALVALCQPWLRAELQRRRAAVSIEIAPGAVISLGFTASGPLIGLRGVLQTTGGDRLMRGMVLELENLADGERSTFTWAGFAAAGREVQDMNGVRPPNSFLFSTADVEHAHLLFANPAAEHRTAMVVRALEHDWLRYLASHARRWEDETGSFARLHHDLRQFMVRRLSANFRAERNNARRIEVLGGLCPWNAGVYRLTLRVHLSQPDEHLSRQFYFVLTDSEAAQLHSNCENIAAEVWGLGGRPSVIYAAALPENPLPPLITVEPRAETLESAEGEQQETDSAADEQERLAVA